MGFITKVTLGGTMEDLPIQPAKVRRMESLFSILPGDSCRDSQKRASTRKRLSLMDLGKLGLPAIFLEWFRHETPLLINPRLEGYVGVYPSMERGCPSTSNAG